MKKAMIFLGLFLIACLCQTDANVPVDVTKTGPEKIIYNLSDAEELFDQFRDKFRKMYADEAEYVYRRKVFKRNLRDINNRNKISDTDVYGITAFTDLTPGEFVNEFTGLKAELLANNTPEPLPFKLRMSNAPTHFDWRLKKAVTPVKHQGACGSCWSFTAVGCVEAQFAKKYGKLVSLSSQQMVDCFKDGGGCVTGSLPHLAFQQAANVGGFMKDVDYPYTYRQGPCKYRPDKVFVRVKKGHTHLVGNEEQLKNMVYTYGPVAIGMFVDRGFSEYRGGIATASHLGCTPKDQINHAILIVGYGTENGVPYWILKNSFGRDWGEQGYMRLERGTNPCNILTYVSTVDII